jgi:diaminohydroxyphosphoribosylaminopyrimidine deaminase/5-amino-6-(5-phosphoribosylamino)uracil reductase
MVGIGTVLADDPMLTCRLPGMAAYSPVRIVLDNTLRLPLASRLVESARDVPVWVIAGADASRRAEETLQAAGVVVLRADATPRRLELILALIAERGITRLMVEGGPTLAAAFVKADLVDQAVLFHSPTVVGPDGIDALEGLPLTALTKSPRLMAVMSVQIGTDREDILERSEGHVHRHRQ